MIGREAGTGEGTWSLQAVRTSLTRLRPTRRTAAALAAVAVLAGALAWGLARSRVETGIESFLPGDDVAVSRFQQLSNSFGGDPVVILLESRDPGALLDQRNLAPLLKLEGRIADLPDVAAVYGPATMLNQVAGRAQDLLAELAGRRDAIRIRARTAAQQRGLPGPEVAASEARATVELDQRYGALLIQGLPAGLPTLRNPAFVNSVVYAADGQPRNRWRFVLPSDRAAAILVRPRQNLDQAATERLVNSTRAAVASAKLDVARSTVSGVPAVAAGLGHEVRREVPILGGAALAGVGVCFLAVPWTRKRRRLVPILSSVTATCLLVAVFGLLDVPMSLGAVAFLPVLLGVGSDFTTYLVHRATPRLVLAVALATAASFASLATVPIPFVRELGISLAVGVLLAYLTGLVAARRTPVGGTEHAGSGVDPRNVRPEQGGAYRPLRLAAISAALVLAAVGWTLMAALPVESDVKAFATGLPALEDAHHVERVIGSSGELSLVLQGPDATSPDALSWMRAARDVAVARHGDLLTPILSLPDLVDYLGPTPTPQQIGAAIRLLPPYISGAVLRADGKEAVLTFGVRLDNVASLGRARRELQEELPRPPPGFRAEFAGLPVVAARGHELVSGSRYLSSLLGIGLAGLVLLLMLTRKIDAARAVGTALIATGLGLFAIWLAGIALNPITVALGSLIAAVGCEFTVLMADAARRKDAALRRAVQLVGGVAVVGFLALALSRLAVIREFGLMLAGAVLLSLAVSTFVVWATERVVPLTSEGK